MSRKEEIKKLIGEHERSLQKLKEKQAFHGFVDTPVRILKEIEDTEAAIEELETELKTLEESRVDEESSSIQNPKRRVQIIQNGDFSSLSKDRWSAAITAFAAVIGIPPQEIEVYRVYEGSIVFDLGIPSDAVQRLRLLLQSDSTPLRRLKIETVRLEKESGEIEEWILKEKKFHLATPTPPTSFSGFHGKTQRAIYVSKNGMYRCAICNRMRTDIERREYVTARILKPKTYLWFNTIRTETSYTGFQSYYCDICKACKDKEDGGGCFSAFLIVAGCIILVASCGSLNDDRAGSYAGLGLVVGGVCLVVAFFLLNVLGPKKFSKDLVKEAYCRNNLLNKDNVAVFTKDEYLNKWGG